jgi:hypothetical protein
MRDEMERANRAAVRMPHLAGGPLTSADLPSGGMR